MGSSHSGKSTIVRSFILDALCENPDKKILIFLSEESKADFLTEFAKNEYRNENGLSRLKIISELDDEYQTCGLRLMLNEFKPDILFYDNLTTSECYMDKRISTQGAISKEFKNIAKKYQIPVVLVVHTGADVTDNMTRLVEMNDIRGCKALVNLANMFYVIQTFKMTGHVYPSIRITKHRGEECEHKLFLMRYDKKKFFYFTDQEITFKQFKEAFQKRDHL